MYGDFENSRNTAITGGVTSLKGKMSNLPLLKGHITVRDQAKSAFKSKSVLRGTIHAAGDSSFYGMH